MDSDIKSGLVSTIFESKKRKVTNQELMNIFGELILLNPQKL